MTTPQTIEQYLAQLRAALAGADPAMIQDALYDAEEHLRSELAENPGMSEAELLAKISTSYGAPDEVAEIYRTTEKTVARALRTPPPRPRRSALGRFFGVLADPHTYGAMFYMLLSLATGIFYFTWAVTGLSMSAGFAVLIIGAPFFLLFMASVRGLSLVESRMVEGMLGVRMPRRPPYTGRERPWLQRIAAMLTDPRTWATLLYMLLMLPLGILYFTIVVTLMSISLALIATPILKAVYSSYIDSSTCVGAPPWVCDFAAWSIGWAGVATWCVLGILLLFVTLHLVRAIGRMHGAFAKHLLVKSARV
ncbi:MAG: sensor domain-containing protein [Xanthomonadaceae bacterium]|nr:sensor domain-containing protein [Xanthomonadaceae bacterium]MBU6477241.1 sensor domain-containing protein [Xanthomonadaceae bacterium]MDE2054947.1 sensor domain-containing protein [Xanthomonadaceae bacterium]